MTVLRTEEVTVRYGNHAAVDGVSFKVDRAQMHGVIGPNGAGKSTFMDALSGRRALSGGRVFLEERDISSRSVVWRRRHGMARSFQQTSVFPALLVRDQLELVARRCREPDLDSVVDALGLEPMLDKRCSEISYGRQRSVDIAMALIGRPKVVLLDEPTAGLAADEGARLLDHVRQLCAERELAAVLVEHDIDSVFRVCDAVTVLNLGQVLAEGEPDTVRGDKTVIDAYLGSAA